MAILESMLVSVVNGAIILPPARVLRLGADNGVVLTWITQRAKSTAASRAVHVIHNMATVVAAYLGIGWRHDSVAGALLVPLSGGFS